MEAQEKQECRFCDEKQWWEENEKPVHRAVTLFALTIFPGALLSLGEFAGARVVGIMMAMILELVFLSFYIPRNVIGQSAYWFRDENGTEHQHLRRPEWVGDQFHDHQDRMIHGPILKLPLSGWFRRLRLLQNLEDNAAWRVVRREGPNIRLRDRDDRDLAVDPELAWKFINYPSTLYGLLNGCRYSVKQGDFRALLVGIAAVVYYLRESKNATRSKVGQHARELLERVLHEVVSTENAQKWMEEAPRVLEKLEQQLAQHQQPEPAALTT